MPVTIGNKVRRSDFETLRTSVNRVFSDDYPSDLPGAQTKANFLFGWGNTELAVRQIGEKVRTGTVDDWKGLVSRVNIGKQHTGAVGSALSHTLGNKVRKLDYDNAETLHNAVIAVKNDVDPGEATITTLATITRNTNWQTLLQWIGTLTFSSYAEARYFFNSGGQLRLSLALTGGTTEDALEWVDLFSDLGTLVFDHDTTWQTGSGGISGNIGLYELTTSEQLLWSQYYHNKDYYYYYYYYGEAKVLTLHGQRNANGTVFTFRLALHNYGGVLIDGTTDLTVGQLKADDITIDGVTFSITAPVYATVQDFTSGS